jgi:hypothetical protein
MVARVSWGELEGGGRAGKIPRLVRVGFFVLKKSCIRLSNCCREKKSWAVGATDLKETNCSASLEGNYCCLVESAVDGQRGRTICMIKLKINQDTTLIKKQTYE